VTKVFQSDFEKQSEWFELLLTQRRKEGQYYLTKANTCFDLVKHQSEMAQSQGNYQMSASKGESTFLEEKTSSIEAT